MRRHTDRGDNPDPGIQRETKGLSRAAREQRTQFDRSGCSQLAPTVVVNRIITLDDATDFFPSRISFQGRIDTRASRETSALSRAFSAMCGVVRHLSTSWGVKVSSQSTQHANGNMPLTARELEVVRLVSSGLSNKLIAHCLGLQESRQSRFISIVSMQSLVFLTGQRSH
jgi:hypothetical protein